jgi:CHAT domain-containing protein
MTNLVWTPLLSELDGIENIYFSPSGALYNIGIEYLPGMEDFNIFRLSSTRELVTGKRIRTGNSAVLYGGLDYYAKLDTLNRSLATPNDTFVEHIDVKGINIRGGRNRLPHTKEEVENIATELRKANWTCLLDTMSLGTEESFKSLSGMGTNTLHIATHGFYYTPEKANETGYKFLQLDNQTASAEDQALTRSGLIMSGANLVLEHKELPDNIEDGILTAKEIADVDLRALDLVVLSACQTGLGDISQGEGVFGLQRGFKKAGANTILMSLWKVNDKATKTLMIQFYKNWLMGSSKRNALRLAQKHLREIEGGKYNEPKYWAAFILLDGIDLAN